MMAGDKVCLRVKRMHQGAYEYSEPITVPHDSMVADIAHIGGDLGYEIIHELARQDPTEVIELSVVLYAEALRDMGKQALIAKGKEILMLHVEGEGVVLIFDRILGGELYYTVQGAHGEPAGLQVARISVDTVYEVLAEEAGYDPIALGG